MRLATPQIAWHGKLRVFSVDLYQVKIVHEEATFWKLASGGQDSDVKIWWISAPGSKIEFRANLRRHEAPVNVVRFSPNGDILASGSDDRAILLWKYGGDVDTLCNDDDDELPNRENWSATKALRGHTSDIFDLAWAPDSTKLFSCAIDDRTIIWDTVKGKKICEFEDHNHYVQGVCWDPKNRFVASQSADRTLNVYSVSSKQLLHSLSRNSASTIEGDFEMKQGKMFWEESKVEGFFRRLAFSPDGSLLVAPAGRLEKNDGIGINTSYVITPASRFKPVLHVPSPDKPTVAVKFSPVLYQLRDSVSSVFDLPYRIVFAVATPDTVVIYDTQQAVPIAMVGRIHYAPITDMSWSADGRLLVVSSSDGYCSFIEFDENEFGIPFDSSPSSTPETERVKIATNVVTSEIPVASDVIAVGNVTSEKAITTDVVALTPVAKSDTKIQSPFASSQATKSNGDGGELDPKPRRLPLSALRTL